jgi:beta-glucosidase
MASAARARPPTAHVRALNEVQRWFIEETRLGIPVDFTDEGIRGVNAVRSTNFSAQCARGATWDRDLISKIGEITGHEGHALGFTNVYSPILDLARDPRWGRVVESYGEDPYLVAELAIRQVKALQSQGVAATAKHFAVYSEPKGARDGDARTDPHVTLQEVEMLHLYPWRRVVGETGLMGAMNSYNDYDGIPMAANHEFLIDRLRDQYGFKGYIVSDSGSVEQLFTKHHVADSIEDACAMFIREGGNVRTDFNPPERFIEPLRNAIADGKLPISIVDARVRDVLRVKFMLGLFDHPYVDPNQADAAVHTAESAQVALQAARESIVLLKNQNDTLPLSKSLHRILVTGPAATITETSHDRY